MTIEREGYDIEIVPDPHHGHPWDEEDGHGPVSGWTDRPKRAGELILAQDGRLSLYYDFAAAVRIALAEEWDAEPYNRDGRETKGEQAAKAARADYERLRDYCNGGWSYVGVVVRPKGACPLCGPSESLWGINSDAGEEYIDSVAGELIEVLA